MQKAGLPENEASRTATLHRMGILDTPREDRFDRYTRITSRAFDMPIALISLIDGRRQWFKSAVGIDGNETPREDSFCGHAILGDGVFEVRNTRLDPRFCDNPLVVRSPRIRFYAGAPLKAPNGHRLGTLCIIDRIPRELSDNEKTMLKNLADMVVGEIMRKVDAETDKSDRVTHMISGMEFFSSIANDRGCSVLLFDIDDVLASHDDENPETSPGEIFAQLLHDHFPTARSIAHIGNYHFCVSLDRDDAFDEIKAINRLCSAAKDLLCFAEGHRFLTPFVGRMQNNVEQYSSGSEMLVNAERMFLKHEREPIPHETDIKLFLKELIGWRKTIF